MPSALTLRIDHRGDDRPVATLDWAAVLLLYPAMRLGRALHLGGKVDPALLFNLNHDVQSLLSTYDPSLQRIAVTADGQSARGTPNTRAMTGFSAGIDSFATLARYGASTAPEGLRVSDLCVFNVGAVGVTHDPATDRLFAQYVERTHAYAESTGRGALAVSINADDFYTAGDMHFQRTHTIRNAAAAFALQNWVGTYLYSSALEYGSLRIAPSYDLAVTDPILLGLLSTSSLTCVSACAGLSRLEKTRVVSTLPDAWGMLDVCVAPTSSRVGASRPNCSQCWKCARTMVTLSLLGELERFRAVFDVDRFYANREVAADAVVRSALRGSSVDREVLEYAEASGQPIRIRPMLRGHVAVMQALNSARERASNISALRRLRERLRPVGSNGHPGGKQQSVKA